MHHYPAVPQEYRTPLFGELDRDFGRFLKAASAVGVLVLLAVLLAPAQLHVITDVDEVPERFARLILKEPPAPAPAATSPAPAATPEAVIPEATPAPPPAVRRTTPVPEIAPDRGEAGREKARQEVTKSLAGATEAAQSAIQDLSASLGKNATPETRPTPPGRRRTVGKGRGNGDVAQVQHGDVNAGGGASIGGSAVSGSLISIESVTTTSGGDGAAGGSPGGTGTAGASASRSNASLLAVIRRYTPGIQFCYDNELKRSPGLRGKYVVALTVAASGAVLEARLASDTVGSARLAECVLGQIRDWKFPAVDGGATVFQTPFVFTPPQE